MSAILEVVNKIFNELVSSNALVKLRERGNPLISEYVFKYGGKCLGSNLEDDFGIEREVTWYQVLTLGIGVKLSVNRVRLSLNVNGASAKLTIEFMGGDRAKSSEEFVFSCDGSADSIYGKTVVDALINIDLISRFLNTVKDRKKLGEGFIDDLVRFLMGARSRVDQDLRRLFGMYQWLDE
ncbi:MAG: hypothetical protein L7G98_03635 [Vulcanisaeta sp.]|nr:hypothetical protein [Vulcanisaeta sp.]